MHRKLGRIHEGEQKNTQSCARSTKKTEEEKIVVSGRSENLNELAKEERVSYLPSRLTNLRGAAAKRAEAVLGEAKAVADGETGPGRRSCGFGRKGMKRKNKQRRSSVHRVFTETAKKETPVLHIDTRKRKLHISRIDDRKEHVAARKTKGRRERERIEESGREITLEFPSGRDETTDCKPLSESEESEKNATIDQGSLLNNQNANTTQGVPSSSRDLEHIVSIKPLDQKEKELLGEQNLGGARKAHWTIGDLFH